MLDVILTDKTLISSKDENENEKEKEKENKNENDKTLMPSNDDDDNENKNDKTLMSSNDDDNDNNENDNNIIKQLNDNLDEIIDKSKSFEDQIKSIRKVKNLDDYYYVNDFGDKELKFKIFKTCALVKWNCRKFIWKNIWS